jgi:hypothetical protein
MIEKIENYNYLALMPAYLANSAEDNATLDKLVNIMLAKLTHENYNLGISPYISS